MMMYYLVYGRLSARDGTAVVATMQASSSDGAIQQFARWNPTVDLTTIVWSELTKEQYDQVNTTMNRDFGRPIISNIFPTRDNDD